MKETTCLTGFAIVVLDRSFIYVGHVKISDGWVVIEDARNIRIWGTAKGLGQLALEGPQENTKLDDCGTVRAPIHALIHTLDTETCKWKD